MPKNITIASKQRHLSPLCVHTPYNDGGGTEGGRRGDGEETEGLHTNSGI